MVVVIPEESAGINPHVKEGIYLGRLAGITERVLAVPKVVNNVTTVENVERLEWTLGVRTLDGDLRMTVLTSPKFSTKSKAFAFAKSLRGGEALVLDVEFNTDDLIGAYGNLTVKDKQRTDRLGKIQITSEITDINPVDKPPEKEINIEGLVIEEEEPTPEVPAPTAPAAPAAQAPAAPPVSSPKGKKKK